MLGLVVLGSRTWIWTIAAPALAASRQELAICSGVTGTAGLRPGVSAEPVTAHEMMILRCIPCPQTRPSRRTHRGPAPILCGFITGLQSLVAPAGRACEYAEMGFPIPYRGLQRRHRRESRLLS